MSRVEIKTNGHGQDALKKETMQSRRRTRAGENNKKKHGERSIKYTQCLYSPFTFLYAIHLVRTVVCAQWGTLVCRLQGTMVSWPALAASSWKNSERRKFVDNSMKLKLVLYSKLSEETCGAQ